MNIIQFLIFLPVAVIFYFVYTKIIQEKYIKFLNTLPTFLQGVLGTGTVVYSIFTLIPSAVVFLIISLIIKNFI